MCSSLGLQDWCPVWEEGWIKAARKAHRCDACGGVIRVGDGYRRHFSIFDGEATFEKVCEPCCKTRDEFLAEHGEQYTPGSTYEQLDECIDNAEDFVSLLKWSRKRRAMEKRAKALSEATP